MPEIEAPVVGAEFDTSDVPGSMMNVAMAILGVTMTLGIVAGGRALWNRIAGEAPGVGSVEVL